MRGKAANAREGLRSEDLRAALARALDGDEARLAELLARHGGLPGPRPNLALAAAFGEAVAAVGKPARGVLATLAREGAPADAARAFLPIAAAYGYAARLATDSRDAWEGVHELAADDRSPSRVGLIAALVAFVAKDVRNLDALVREATGWLDGKDREHVFAAQAIALDVVADRAASLTRAAPEPLFAWLEQILAAISDAPRAAERSFARRRVLAALPGALAECAGSIQGGSEWLIARANELTHEDLRIIVSRTADALRRGGRAHATELLTALESAHAFTAKAPRDPTLIREGTGRGKKGRRRAR